MTLRVFVLSSVISSRVYLPLILPPLKVSLFDVRRCSFAVVFVYVILKAT